VGRSNILNERMSVTSRTDALYMQEPEEVEQVIVDVAVIVMLETEIIRC
jgi:hypothetical protein